MLTTLRALMQPPPGMAVDFSQPPGEPALAPADGVAWRVFANPVALFAGGVAAVLLELAEPSVRAGVWNQSGFRSDPGMRLRRTGFAAMMTVYGPRSAAEKLIAHVVQVHGQVRGRTPDGLPYHANDPRLLDWVQATAVFGFSQAYHRYVQPLSPLEKDAAFAESQPAARLYGATGVPQSWAAWEALLARTAPSLEGSSILSDFLTIMDTAPLVPAPMRPCSACWCAPPSRSSRRRCARCRSCADAACVPAKRISCVHWRAPSPCCRWAIRRRGRLRGGWHPSRSHDRSATVIIAMSVFARNDSVPGRMLKV